MPYDWEIEWDRPLGSPGKGPVPLTEVDQRDREQLADERSRQAKELLRKLEDDAFEVLCDRSEGR